MRWTSRRGVLETLAGSTVPALTGCLRLENGGGSTTRTAVTDTATRTDPSSFQERFEDGSYDDSWRILWLQSGGFDGPQQGERPPLNEWTVKETSTLEGSYALHLHSEADGNGLVTADPVIEIDGDFDFEYSFRTPDPDNRGVHVDLVDVSTYGSRTDPVTDTIPHLKIGSARRQPANGKAVFHALGTSTEVSFETFDPRTQHRIRVERRGDTVIGYHNDTEIARGSVDFSETALDVEAPHQLVFRSSASYGDESYLWLDDISFTTV